jgi:hypothetical protein
MGRVLPVGALVSVDPVFKLVLDPPRTGPEREPCNGVNQIASLAVEFWEKLKNLVEGEGQ